MPPVFVEERIAEIEQLCREHHVARLELFGSAVDGRFRPGESDLDFLVTYAPDSHQGLFEHTGLMQALADLFGTEVDLVEEIAIRNPYFAQGVDLAPKTLLYVAPDAPPKQRNPIPHPAPECNPLELRTKKLLYDMTKAAGNIVQFTEGKTFDDYEQDLILRSAAERSFEIVGEAMARLVRHDSATARRISDYRDIINFRNIIAHDYDELQNQKVWAAIELHLATLLREAEALLGE